MGRNLLEMSEDLMKIIVGSFSRTHTVLVLNLTSVDVHHHLRLNLQLFFEVKGLFLNYFAFDWLKITSFKS